MSINVQVRRGAQIHVCLRIYRIVLCYRSDDVEMTLSRSFKHGQVVSLTDLIHNSPTANMECAQLHYLTVAIVEIALTFNLFPLRVLTMLSSQAKGCLGEELHIDIGQLEEKVKRSSTLERTQKQV